VKYRHELAATPAISALYSERARRIAGSAMMKTYGQPRDIKYPMGTGLPDATLFPVEELRRYASLALDIYGRQCLTYGFGGQGNFAGPLVLRQALARHASAKEGRDIDPDGIVLASGASHGIALAANAYLSPGDAVLAEELTWPWALRYMTEAGAAISPVPMDADGMIVDALESRIKELESAGLRPKMIYTIPTFHIPTGTCLPLRRRKQLLAVAERHRLVVLEDNLYYDLRYTGAPVPSLLSLDESGLVLQSNGFSKTLATGLRMAWVAGSPQATLPLELVRQDLGVNQWIAHTLALWLDDGRWDKHLDLVLESARRKHRVAGSALRRYCEPYLRFTVPEGGIYFWLELAPGVDAARLRALLDDEGVGIAPGERFTPDDAGRRYFRLAFLDVDDHDLEAGIAVIGRCLARSVAKGGPASDRFTSENRP
jgi:2-aminoadipate transaminase